MIRVNVDRKAQELGGCDILLLKGMSVASLVSVWVCLMVDQDQVVIEKTTVAGKFCQQHLGLTERWMKDEVIEPRHHAAATQYAFC